MKKVIAGVVLALMVAIVPVALVGCSVPGTYKFSTVTVSFAENVDAATKEQVKAEVELMKTASKGTKVTLKSNGKVVVSAKDETGKTVTNEEGLWKKVKGTTYLFYEEGHEDEGTEVTIKGGKLIMTFSSEGVTMKTIYKK